MDVRPNLTSKVAAIWRTDVGDLASPALLAMCSACEALGEVGGSASSLLAMRDAECASATGRVRAIVVRIAVVALAHCGRDGALNLRRGFTCNTRRG
jgi:hypothetical protein